MQVISGRIADISNFFEKNCMLPFYSNNTSQKLVSRDQTTMLRHVVW